MSVYTLKACEELIDRYVNELGGVCDTLEEGCLGLGTVLLHSAKGKKTIVIKEVYVNEWASEHKVRMYNKIPKKYEEALSLI